MVSGAFGGINLHSSAYAGQRASPKWCNSSIHLLSLFEVSAKALQPLRFYDPVFIDQYIDQIDIDQVVGIGGEAIGGA